ncbi:FAD-dependent hydroxylase [Phormidium tenue FACHB-886]|nr:FAD-dependent hydroxylase [Phormidium tenue FACHB-886]
MSLYSLPTPAEFDITIVGAGIAGLTLACALKDTGLKIALIEANPREAGLTQRRAYAITLMSGRIFQGLGVWDDILPQISTFQQIRLADAEHPTIVNLQPEDLGTAELGYVGEHCVLVKALLDKLQDADSITWLCPATLQKADYLPDFVELTVSIDGQLQQVRSRLLIAADGSRSPIRQQAGIGTKGWQYWQSCVTAVIRPEKDHQNVAREHFWQSGPFASLPLPGNRYQIVLTAPHAEAKRWLEVEEVEFLSELNRRYAGQLGKLELIGKRTLFPVQLMQSDRYTQNRLALVGDAAHCCHPVGGQGLNLGIRDVAALAQVLQAAQQRGEDIGSLAVLKRYERWRKLENLTILGFTDVLDRVFSNRWLPLVAVRRLGLSLMRHVRPLKFIALWLMTGGVGRCPELAKR